jgi:hypothetical protein
MNFWFGLLLDQTEPDDADDNQIDRNDEIQKPRHDENENAGEKRDDGLNVSCREDHGKSPKDGKTGIGYEARARGVPDTALADDYDTALVPRAHENAANNSRRDRAQS